MIDAFTHILPTEYSRRLHEELGKLEDQDTARFQAAALSQDERLSNLETRLQDMSAIGSDYRQVLTLPGPYPDDFEPAAAAELARIGNQGMKQLVVDYPDRFVGFVAGLPMNSTEAALAELEYAVTQEGALGIQLPSSVCGRPLDDPAFEPVFTRIAELGKTVWLHPVRSPMTPDYAVEDRSRYFLFGSFGWPYETTLAMSRLVFSGLMERLPDLKVIAHHGGGMVPTYYGRVAVFDKFARSRGIGGYSLSLPAVEYFRRFYVDSKLDDVRPALSAAVAFFGADHVLFGSDYGLGHDPRVDASTVGAIGLSKADQEQIFEGNARRILGVV